MPNHILSAAFALLAHERKTEGWATMASLGLVLAGVITARHYHPDNAILVTQVAMAVLGGAALLRLACR